MELRDEFELVDASLKRNMLLRKQLFYLTMIYAAVLYYSNKKCCLLIIYIDDVDICQATVWYQFIFALCHMFFEVWRSISNACSNLHEYALYTNKL